MKAFTNTILIIFFALCTIFGLALNKGYAKYISHNLVIEWFIKATVFLAVLRVGLILIVPLMKSTLGYLNLNLSTVNLNLNLNVGEFLIKYFNNPVFYAVVLSLALYYALKR